MISNNIAQSSIAVFKKTFVNHVVKSAGTAVLSSLAVAAIYAGYSNLSKSKKIQPVFRWIFSSPPLVSDLTKETKSKQTSGELSKPTMGRDAEIERIESLLTREHKNVVAVTGRAGVGKSAIIREIVARQANGQSAALKNQTVKYLNINELQGVNKGIITNLQQFLFEGGEASLFHQIISDLKKEKNSILFIDECHRILNLPVFEQHLADLAEGGIKIVMATTKHEFVYYAKRWDEALIRRVEEVEIKEFTLSQTIDALTESKGHYEKYYNISIDAKALIPICILADQYKPRRAFPDKAVDLLDEICSAMSNRIKSNKNLSKPVEPLLNSQFVYEYCKTIFETPSYQLQNEAEKIIESLDLNKTNAAFIKNIQQLPITPEYPALFKPLDASFNDFLTKIHAGENPVLICESKAVQNLIFDYSNNKYQIIKLNLKSIIAKMLKWSPSVSNRFIDEFTKLFSEAKKNNQLFLIEDPQTILDVLEKKLIIQEKRPAEPSSNQDPKKSTIISNLLSNIPLGKFEAPVNNILDNISQNISGNIPNKPSPELHESDQQDYKESNSPVHPLIALVVKTIEKKEIQFIGALTKKAFENKSSFISEHYTPILIPRFNILGNWEAITNFVKCIQVKKNLTIGNDIVTKAYFLSTCYLSGNPDFPLDEPDATIALLDRTLKKVDGRSISVTNITQQTLIEAFNDIIREYQFQSLTPYELDQILNQASNVLGNDFFLDINKIHEKPIKSDLKQIGELAEKIHKRKKTAYFLVDNSKKRRALLKNQLIFELEQRQHKVQLIFKDLNIASLLKSPLPEAKMKEFISLKFKEFSNQKLDECILFIEHPFNELPQMIRIEIEALVVKNSMRVVYLCSSKDFKNEKKGEETSKSQENSSDENSIWTIIKSFASTNLGSFLTDNPIASTLFKTEKKKEDEMHPPLFKESSKVICIEKPNAEEIVYLLKKEKEMLDQEFSTHLNDSCLAAFQKIYSFFQEDIPHTRMLKMLRNVYISEHAGAILYNKNKAPNLEQVFTIFADSLKKDVDDIKDAYNPNLTTFKSKARRKCIAFKDWGIMAAKSIFSASSWLLSLIPMAGMWGISKLLFR